MKCNNCGAEITEGMVVCPYCATQVEPSVQVLQEVSQSDPIQENTIVGKKYEFVSAYGTNMRGILSSRIYSNVEIAGDRILINISPKRLNTAPVVILEDITAIDISVKINLYYWFFIVISAIAAIGTMGVSLLLTALFVFVGRNQIITISQRNGKNVVMYSHDKQAAEAFREDMKTITKIG